MTSTKFYVFIFYRIREYIYFNQQFTYLLIREIVDTLTMYKIIIIWIINLNLVSLVSNGKKINFSMFLWCICAALFSKIILVFFHFLRYVEIWSSACVLHLSDKIKKYYVFL